MGLLILLLLGFLGLLYGCFVSSELVFPPLTWAYGAITAATTVAYLLTRHSRE